MRAVVQRVSQASVTVADEVVGDIGIGLLVLLGVGQKDTEIQARWMAAKISGLRIFEDGEGKMNLSVLDVRGEVLLVSQFTLYGDCSKGRRPSFVDAARPESADKLYRATARELEALGCPVATGKFQHHMEVRLCNDGPVTIILESP